MEFVNQVLVCITVLVSCHQVLSCPEACTCVLNIPPYLVACNAKGLTAIPTDDIPVEVEELYLTGNHFNALPQGALSKFENLKNLRMTKCEIETIEQNAFSGLSKLLTLDLRWNKIKALHSYLFSGLFRLQNLQLDNNDIESIENFAFNGLNLTRLGLERNDRLRHISEKAFNDAKVEVLILHNSSLSNKAAKALKPLKSSLKELYWQSNQRPVQLRANAFEGFTFRILDLNNNGIRDVAFLEQVVTDELSLENNPIGPIDFSLFPNLRQVRKLNLDNSSFSVVQASFFNGMTHLRFLGLANNGITSLGEGLKPVFTRLQRVAIHDNKLHCNCELRWLKRWLISDPQVNVNDGEPVKCSTPSEGDIATFDDEYLTCSSPRIITISRTLNVSENEELALTCVGEGDPAPTIRWSTPDGQVVLIPPPNNRSHTENQGIYHIKSTSASSRGMYRCTADNLAGNVTQEAHVDVYKAKAVAGQHTDSATTASGQLALTLLFAVLAKASVL